MSTPSDYGYAPCIRCGTQRPIAALVAHYEGIDICSDIAWCSKQKNSQVGSHTPVAHIGSPEVVP